MTHKKTGIADLSAIPVFLSASHLNCFFQTYFFIPKKKFILDFCRLDFDFDFDLDSAFVVHVLYYLDLAYVVDHFYFEDSFYLYCVVVS